MIARARSAAASRGDGASARRAGALAALILSGIVATPASAQVSGSIDIESDYRLRGYSLSAGRPVATAQIGYDDDSGVYLNLSATGMLGRDDPLFLGVQGNIGYARRLSGKLSIDGGLLRSQYRAPDRTTRSHDYTEVYLGLVADPFSARIYYSPDYYRSDVSTLYGEIEATVRPAKDWRINGHLGSLVYLSTPTQYFPGRQTRYDWRIGVSRRLGNFDLHAALSGGGPGREYYAGSLHDKTALTAGVSWSF
ncbi:MAG: TorF family putative porin [Sphingomonas sp.]|uniref:TorF family putative porin n=1 Tax=Sphingomonas sp. TaxID=28214 RepID=UPI003F7E66DB